MNRYINFFSLSVKVTWREFLLVFILLAWSVNVAGQVQEDYEGHPGWIVEDVPNPKTHDADNWISDPDNILSGSAEDEINGILQQLEDSLSIEVAVVALNSIGEQEPHEFALSLFNRWGVGKAEDDNGLLILLTLDIRDITFKTGYGLEGVLPDILCKRIQMENMVPYLQDNDWDTGMTEGVKAVVATLYGSDYQAAPPDAWIRKFSRTAPPLVLIVFGIMIVLINWLVWRSFVHQLTPESDSTQAAITVLATKKPLGIKTLLGVIWLVPVWPALLGIALWYWGWQRKRLKLKSRTCPHCGRTCLKPVPVEETEKHQDLLSDSELMESNLKTAYIRIFRCTACGRTVKVRIPLERAGYECCPDCRNMTLHKEEEFRTVKNATTSSEGLMEASHRCLHCGARYIVGYRIPKISPSSRRSGGSGGSGGGSFGGGSSGGGGSSSRF